MITTIVFDFGNVVGFFDYRRTTEQLARHSPHSSEELCARIYGGDLEDAYESGRITSDDFLRRVRQACGIGCDEETLRRAYADMFWPNEEVCALVPQLKPRYRLLLGSNTNELHSQHFRRQFADVLGHFDALVLSHEVGARKPRPEFFLAAQRRAGRPAAECLFIDDLEANVAGARALGWHGIVYRPGRGLARQLAELGISV
jgi:putative hydrolase of the HAD superfamily